MHRGFSRRDFLSVGAMVVGILGIAVAGQSWAQDPFQVAIVLPGVITDNGWNQAGYEGLESLKESIGAETAYVEKVAQADQVEALADFARRGYDVVIGHGGQFDAAILQVADQFPDTFFIATNGEATAENVAALQMNTRHLGYLMGVLAASMTESNTIGYVAGLSFKATNETFRGYELGARAINPEIEVIETYAGDFNDIAKGKEAALAMIGAGADVIYESLDNSAPAVLTAAQDNNVYTIANYADLFEVAPESVLTSVVQSVGVGNAKLAEQAHAGQLEGKIYVFGFDTPEVLSLGQINPAIPEEVQQRLEDTKQALINNSITFVDCQEDGKDTFCVSS